MVWDARRSTYQVFGVSAKIVDGLRDVAVLPPDEHVVLFGADQGDEGQEGDDEEGTHFGNRSAAVVMRMVLRLDRRTFAVRLDEERSKRELGHVKVYYYT